MKKFKMWIETMNAAFWNEDKPDPVPELVRILRVMADQLEMCGELKKGDDGGIMDVAGNIVGAWEVR